MLHTKVTALCSIEREYFRSKFYTVHCGNMNFRPFWLFVSLTLTRWPSYTNLTLSPWRCTACANMNLLRQGFRNLSSDIAYIGPTHIHTERQIYRQTDTTKLYTTPLRRWSKIRLAQSKRNCSLHSVKYIGVNAVAFSQRILHGRHSQAQRWPIRTLESHVTLIGNYLEDRGRRRDLVSCFE